VAPSRANRHRDDDQTNVVEVFHLIKLRCRRCEARTICTDHECERSPTPVRVGVNTVNTLCPPLLEESAHATPAPGRARRRARARRVFGAPVCRRCWARPKAAALAPAHALASSRGGSWLRAVVKSSCPPETWCWRNLTWGSTWDESVGLNGAKRQTAGAILSICALPDPRPPWITGTIGPVPTEPGEGLYWEAPRESPRPASCAFRPIPRSARAASGFGGRRPARAAQEGGAPSGRDFRPQQGENAFGFLSTTRKWPEFDCTPARTAAFSIVM